MPSVIQQILTMGNNLLTKGIGAKDSLSSILRQPFSSKLLSLALDSSDGTLLSLGPQCVSTKYARQKMSLHSAPVHDPKNEKRFLFSMTQTQWDVLTALNVGPFSWFTLVTLDISSTASTPLKSGIFKLADYFTMQCRTFLYSFLTEIAALCTSAGSSFTKTAPEQELLDKIAGFSSEIQSILLLNENGSLIYHSGSLPPPEELAHSLIQFHHRSNSLLPSSTPAPFEAITLSDNEYTVEIGRIRGTNLLIVISACGDNALATSRFIRKIALDAFHERLKITGSIAGIKRIPPLNTCRVQDSWFSPPRVIPQGIFAGIIGTALFHDPQCRALSKVSDEQIIWFHQRSEPLQYRLQPCQICDP